jgi:hypothetical protein
LGVRILRNHIDMPLDNPKGEGQRHGRVGRHEQFFFTILVLLSMCSLLSVRVAWTGGWNWS